MAQRQRMWAELMSPHQNCRRHCWLKPAHGVPTTDTFQGNTSREYNLGMLCRSASTLHSMHPGGARGTLLLPCLSFKESSEGEREKARVSSPQTVSQCAIPWQLYLVSPLSPGRILTEGPAAAESDASGAAADASGEAALESGAAADASPPDTCDVSPPPPDASPVDTWEPSLLSADELSALLLLLLAATPDPEPSYTPTLPACQVQHIIPSAFASSLGNIKYLFST